MVQSNTADTRFKIEDLFFSRTDERGVIQSGNNVFQYVSEYSWEQLLGAPHKIIRHPDMPSGAFSLMWSMIQAGEPFGGYVINKAADDTSYWVFSAVLPLDDGYISLRLKPSAGHLNKIVPLYEMLRKEERSGGLSPEASKEKLLQAVHDLGFHSYKEFMTRALCDEVAAREAAMQDTPFVLRETLGKMLDGIRALEVYADMVEKTFSKTHQIPYNMRLQAGRLEGSDGPISVISGNHRMMTQSLEENLGKFGKESSVGAEDIGYALFVTAVSNLLGEIREQLSREDYRDAETKDHELSLLQDLKSSYEVKAAQEVKEMSERVRRFGDQCRQMRRMMSGLELTRIMCKIERSKFTGEHSGLDEIVNGLSSAQEQLGNEFDGILDTVTEILSGAEVVNRMTQSGDWAKVA